MADQWVCLDCGHPTPVEPGTEGCPECGGKMEKIEDLDNDLTKADYKKDEMETPLEEEIDLPETDDEEEDEDAEISDDLRGISKAVDETEPETYGMPIISNKNAGEEPNGDDLADGTKDAKVKPIDETVATEE